MTKFELIYHWANNRVDGYIPIHEIINAELFTIIIDLAASGMELEKRIVELEKKVGIAE